MQADLGLILAGGGESRRFGGCKLLAPFCGEPLFLACLRNLAQEAAHTVFVTPAAYLEKFKTIAAAAHLEVPVEFVAGGATREESVFCGISALERHPEVRYAAIQDAARPLSSKSLLLRTLQEARRVGGAIPGKAVPDTMKRVEADGRILATISREKLYAVSTPQIFELAKLREAWQKANRENSAAYTDDASVMESAGFPVVLVRDDPWNFKVTFPEDLLLLERLKG